MNTIKILIVMLVGTSLFLTACDNKKTSRSSPARVARGGATQPFNTQGLNGTPGFNNYTNSIGSEWTYVRSDDSNSFFSAVQGLVSASMDPQELGTVMPYGDVAIIGYIDMDQTGNINRANSRLRLEIWDDYARAGTASEIALAFNSLADSNFNGNQVKLVFHDGYGDIIIDGEYSQTDFYGRVSYQNTKSYDGTSSFAAGVLGNFQVPVCGFFRCQ